MPLFKVRAFRLEETAGAKALWQECAWRVKGRARRPWWLSERERESWQMRSQGYEGRARVGER